MTAYSFAHGFDMSRGRTAPRAALCTFLLKYNGRQIGEFATLEAAETTADKAAEACCTARECFSIERRWL